MDAPGRPHVRINDGYVFIERVPNAWVQVCLVDDWQTMNNHERNYLIEKALKHGRDTELPTKEGPDETFPRST